VDLFYARTVWWDAASDSGAGLTELTCHSRKTPPVCEGRIDCTDHDKAPSPEQNQAHCLMGHLSYDVLHNQILKIHLSRLCRVTTLSPQLRADARNLLRQLHEIADIKLNRFAFRKLQFHRNNGFYRFLMRVCELVQQNLRPMPKRAVSASVSSFGTNR